LTLMNASLLNMYDGWTVAVLLAAHEMLELG